MTDADTVDAELNKILNRLNDIQREVGGKNKKKILGEDGKIDRFMEIKSNMIDRLMNIREVTLTRPLLIFIYNFLIS